MGAGMPAEGGMTGQISGQKQDNRRQTGAVYERKAGAYLERQGL